MATLDSNPPRTPPASTGGTMRLAVVALVLFALAIAVPGVLGLLAVAGASGGGAHGASEALNEARAVGGTRLAIAALLFVAATSVRRRRVGLVAGIVVFGATLLGRLLSNVLDGAPGAMLGPEVAEAVLITLAVVSLRFVPAGDPR